MDDDLDLDELAADVVQRLADDAVDTDLPDNLPNGDLSDLHADEADSGAGDDDGADLTMGKRLTDEEVDAMDDRRGLTPAAKGFRYTPLALRGARRGAPGDPWWP